MQKYPLLISQTEIFYEWIKNPKSTNYNLPLLYWMKPDYSSEQIETALRKLAETHLQFYVRFGLDENSEPYQYIDMNSLSIKRIATEESKLETLKYELITAFDLFEESPVRFVIIETEAHTYLFIDIHHISFDGTSITVFQKELGLALNGEALDGEELSLVDYSLQEKDKRQSTTEIESDLKYFGELLGGASVEPLPQKAQLSEAVFSMQTFSIDKKVLNNLYIQYRVTLSALFSTALSIVLSKYNREEKLAFTLIHNGRLNQALGNSIGAFVRSLPIVFEADTNANIVDVLSTNKATIREAITHQTASLSEIIRHTGISSKVAFNYMKFENGETLFSDNREIIFIDEPNFPLRIDIRETETSSEFEVFCNSGKYDEQEISRFIKAYKNCILDIANNPHKKYSEIFLISEEEKEEILSIGSGDKVDYNQQETFVDVFNRQAISAPDKIAVVDEISSITYHQLGNYSNILANSLIKMGVQQNSFIAIMLPRRKEFVISVLASFKAGGAYLPLDSDYPVNRLQYMLEDSGAKVLITTRQLYDEKLKTDGITPNNIIFIDEFDFNAGDEASVKNAQPDNLAYMIYTSGSTGTPKGVMIQHKSLVSLLAGQLQTLGLNHDIKLALHPSFSFDGSIFDLFSALFVGGQLHIISSQLRMNITELQDYIIQNKITGMLISTQFGLELIQLSSGNLPLSFMIIGGEKLPALASPNFRLVNAYGPTEFTVYSHYHTVLNDESEIPIGRPVPNSYCYVVDKNGNLLPHGIAGELCLSGQQISLGYWNRPELTAEKFVDCKFRQNEKMYRTGDLVRWNENDELEYIGRIDTQVKLRGFRIELGEIENKLSQYPDITSSVVEIKEVSEIKHIVAYYSAKSEIDSEKLKAFMAEGLTEYMIPTFFVQMEALPLTPNGKVNRKELPLPETKEETIVPPGTEKEIKLHNLLSSILKTDSLGTTNNLISYGMTSIVAIKFSVAVQKEYNWSLSVNDILSYPTIEKLANLVKTNTEENSAKGYPFREYYPITENQRALYVDWLRNPKAIQYNMPMAYRFENIEAELLEKALRTAIQAHPYIKTKLAQREDDIVQLRRDAEAINIELSILDKEPNQNYLQELVRPFDLLNDDLYRIRILKFSRSTFLFMDFHHIIMDGASLNILLEDIQRAYKGDEIPTENYTAFDKAIDESLLKQSIQWNEADKYYDNLLHEYETTIYPHSKDNDNNTGIDAVFSKIPRENIAKYCRENAITENNFFLTATMEVLSRITREEKILISTISGGRADKNLNNVVGMFVKTLPTVYQSTNQCIGEAMHNIQKQNIATLERDFYPYTSILTRHNIKPQILFVYQGGMGQSLVINEQLPTNIPLTVSTVKLPFSIIIFPNEGEYQIEISFDPELYSETDVRAFESMLSNFALNCLDKRMQISSIKNTSTEIEEKLLSIGSGDKIDYNQQETFVDVFNRQAISAPDKIAVVDEISSITYHQLGNYSNILANSLIKMGVQQNSFIAIMLPRRKEFVISVLASFKAGGAYLPLDSDYPVNRLQYMLEDSGAKVLITTRQLYDEKLKTDGITPNNIIFIDEFDFNAGDEASVNNAQPDNLAYMIYTSGSTGTPKGVMIRHKSLVSLLVWHVKILKLNNHLKSALHPSFSFDASIDDLFHSLFVGGQLHIMSSKLRMNIVEMRDYIIENNISGMTLSTQFGVELIKSSSGSLPLSFLLVGGEKLPALDLPNFELINGYGPTEFTVCSHYHSVLNNESEIPIGRPVPNSYCYVVDKNGNLLPPGIAGELCLSGQQISLGYWNRPELTAEKFVDCKFRQNEKMYRTGDLVRWNENDELEYIGRIDTQVKLRGFRIELGEIENKLSQYPDITSSVVEIKEVSGVMHLVAYYSAKSEIDSEKLKAFMAEGLTEYMIPTFFVQMEALPLTPNGKVNRKELPLPEVQQSSKFLPPSNKVEASICDVFAKILKLNQVSVLDNFFKIGGTSLNAIKAIIEITNAGYSIQYSDLFKLKTPRAIANFLLNITDDDNLIEDKFNFSNFDYTTINQVLEKNNTNFDIGFSNNAFSNVLITGATGYLGIHLLREVIDSEAKQIFCLVRSNNKLTAEARLKNMLMYYFGDTFETQFDSNRIIVIDGDIANTHVLDTLNDKSIDLVINSAALVKHYVADDAMDKINIEGVNNLIDFCLKNNSLLVHISTYSISGARKTSWNWELFENQLFVGQQTDNEYIRTKFLAERNVLEAISKSGLNAKIMRVGNLMGRESDGEFQVNFQSNAFINRLKSYKVLRAYPVEQMTLPIEISPIDKVAEAIIILSRTPKELCVFHPFNNYRINMAVVIKAMKDYGFSIEIVSNSAFNERYNSLITDSNKSIYLQGLLHNKNTSPNELVFGHANNDWTTTLLYSLGFHWNLTNVDYSKQLIGMLDGLGFFDE